MRKSRFSIEHIVAVLKQVEMGIPVADVMRQLGISEQTFYRWKKLYAGLQPDPATASAVRPAHLYQSGHCGDATARHRVRGATAWTWGGLIAIKLGRAGFDEAFGNWLISGVASAAVTRRARKESDVHLENDASRVPTYRPR